MAKSETKLVIFGAIAANVLIAVAKFVAAAFTGSSAMISEGIHSLVDTADGLLLLVGERRSRRPADDAHPFGHGKELYFWSMIVSIMIFGVGGGMTVYEGIIHLVHPTPIENAAWNYAVLGMAFVFEGTSWVIALRHFLAAKPEDHGVLETVRKSKDPTEFVILFEDSAALIGIVIAFTGVFLGELLRNAYLDGIASILIGVVLAAVALVLARETRGLLVGESVDRKRAEAIRAIAAADAAIAFSKLPLTMYVGPDYVLVNLEVQFQPGVSLHEVESAIRSIEERIRGRFPEVKRIFIEAGAFRDPTRSGDGPHR